MSVASAIRERDVSQLPGKRAGTIELTSPLGEGTRLRATFPVG